MISVGGSIIAGIALGAKDTKRCSTAFNQTMVITVITMICLSVVVFFCFKPMLRDTFLNGSSECIGELSMCISMFSYNFVIMRRIGVDGVTAFTIVSYISYIFSMIIIGFGQGSSPIISFSFGSGNKQLARNIRKRTNSLVFGAGLVVIALIICTSSFYSRLFVNDENIQKMVRTGILIFIFNFLFCGINAISSFYFTSIGKAKESAIISCARGLVLLLASIYILPLFLGMNGIWLTSPVIEFLTLFLSLAFIKQDSKE